MLDTLGEVYNMSAGMNMSDANVLIAGSVLGVLDNILESIHVDSENFDKVKSMLCLMSRVRRSPALGRDDVSK